MSGSKHILIAGAGIAGPALALLLSRTGHQCTVVERAPAFRTSGQQIDLAGEGWRIAKFMSIEEDVRARTVRDDGIKFVDTNDKAFAEFPVSENQSLVREIEIMRSDLAEILYARTKGRAEYIFGDRITELCQHDSGVMVTFESSTVKEFDLVVAADGLRGRTRDLAFDSKNTQLASLGTYVAIFSIPWKASDDTWSRAYNAPDRRVAALRPDKQRGLTGACLAQMLEDNTTIAKMSQKEQIREVSRRFEHAGWETDRILKELEGPGVNDFYLQEVAQAKSASLVSGRVVLLGDAGYCPSPFSGQGTTLSFIGAYILAGCIASNDDHRDALAQYEKEVRPFIDKLQRLPPGIPGIVYPHTAWGITVLSSVVWLAGLVVKSGVPKILGKASESLPTMFSKRLELPQYPALGLME